MSSLPATPALARAAAVQPLYNPARLLGAGAAQAIGLLETARGELARAQREASELREAAHLEAANITGSAAQQVALAVEEGRRAAAEEVRRHAHEFFAAFEAETSRLGDQLAAHAQRSAWLIASAVLKVEFAVRPDTVVDVVSSALREARLYERVTVCVHPGDLALIEPHVERLRALSTVASSFSLRADPSVQRGGVRIDTEMGSFDGSVEARLARLAAAVGKGHAGREGGA